MRSPRIALLALFLCSCASKEEPLPPLQLPSFALPERFTGIFEYGFEGQVFYPCGSVEAWWVWGAPKELQSSIGQRTYVVFAGVVSEPGRYGHLGQYARELRVNGVLKSGEAAEAEACAGIREPKHQFIAK